MPAKIKIRSVSVEDLGNIVKHMIDGVLEDNDQVAKLYQAVFEEYYFKKMEELKLVKSKIDDDKLDQKVMRSSAVTADDIPLKCGTADHNFSNECSLNETLNLQNKNSSNVSEKANQDDTTIAIESSNSSTVLNFRKVDEDAAINNFQNEIGDSNPRVENSGEVVNAPVVHVVRRLKYTKVRHKPDTEIAENCGSNIALNSMDVYTTTNLTRARDDESSPTAKSEEKIESEKSSSNNTAVVEWWNSSLKKKVTEQSKDKLTKPREIIVQFKDKGEMAFDNWKKEKTSMYRRIFKEEQKKIRLEQAAKAEQMAKKETANKAYLHWRRQQDARQKLISNTKKRISAQIQSQKLKSHEKRVKNSQAFKIWKRQKDVKLRERKMYMMAYDQQCYPQNKPKPEKPKPGVHVAFNMWLDQLDCVLHQKYLRERRYLVHSFYCQPAYFGSAALCPR